MSEPFEMLIPEQLSSNGIEMLDLSISHTARIVTLPFHHRDPFDRLLAVQAQVEGLTLIIKDEIFNAYAISRVW